MNHKNDEYPEFLNVTLKQASYFDLLSKLKHDVDNDTTLPQSVKQNACNLLYQLKDLLWDYSY